MAQFMQPLACFSDQPSAPGFGQICVVAITLCESFQPFRRTGWKQTLRRLRQLLLKEAIKPLVPALKV